MVTTCTYNARTLASESSIEDLLMEARSIKYDVIGMAETRRCQPFNAVYDTGEELFLGTCDSKGVGGVGVLVNTSLSTSIDPFEQLTTRIERLRLRRRGSIPALTSFVVYAPTSSYDEEEVEAFYMDLEKFYREDNTFFKIDACFEQLRLHLEGTELSAKGQKSLLIEIIDIESLVENVFASVEEIRRTTLSAGGRGEEEHLALMSY
ncbi:unnamed protein product [Angiostrongylus costaricensis]|uniref:Endo/exonuclease/phosphatase domain-containing protein n=1 Tax=Angiostrongylus costaricensis TaxID=334426 RepID=A0A158PES3_ANGCS|nr:unnamed protein product [Angiostrongylus costaricensis]